MKYGVVLTLHYLQEPDLTNHSIYHIVCYFKWHKWKLNLHEAMFMLQQANKIKLNKAKPYQQGILWNQKSSHTHRNHILHFNQHFSAINMHTCITGKQIPFLYQNRQLIKTDIHFPVVLYTCHSKMALRYSHSWIYVHVLQAPTYMQMKF